MQVSKDRKKIDIKHYQPYMVDYHTHNYLCGHAVGELEEYVKRAIDLGFQEIALTDHLPLFHLRPEEIMPGITMSQAQMPAYIEECLRLKDLYAQKIAIKVGIESDYAPGWEEYLASELAKYPYDFILGSVHFIGDWDHSDSRVQHRWQGRDVNDTYREYYKLIQGAAQSNLFDSIGHVDVIKRFNHLPTEDLTDLYYETFKIIKKADVCVEYNSSGNYMPVAEAFPSNEILRIIHELDITMTMGSDSHQPDVVGRDLETAMDKLREIGFDKIAGFEERKRYYISLGEKDDR